MFAKAREFVRRHKAVTALAVVAAAAAISAAAWAAVALGPAQAPPEESPEQQGEQQEQETAEEPTGMAALPEEDRAIVEGYSGGELALSELLAASLWVSETGNDYLTFEDGAAHLHREDGSVADVPFIIDAASSSATEASAQAGSAAAACRADGEACVLQLVRSTKQLADGEQDVTYLVCDVLTGGSNGQKFMRQQAADGFEMTGVPDGAVELLGGDADVIEDALAEYCAAAYPAADGAAFADKVSIDYSTMTADASFLLPLKNRTEITLRYNMTDGSYAVAR